MIKIFVTNLSQYNAGILNGEWVTLPSYGELEEAMNRVSNDGKDELFITDYETELEIKIDEYEDMLQLDEIAEQIHGLDDYEAEHLKAYMEASGYELKHCLECFEDSVFYPNMDLLDVAYELVEDMSPDRDSFLLRYFNYEAFARDLSFDGYTEVSNGVICLY